MMGMLAIKFYPESDKPEFIQAAQEYQDIWNKEGKRIVDVIEKTSGLKFVEKSINALVFEGRSCSYPLLLRESYPKEVKKAMLIHELCHRLLSGNNVKIEAKDSTKKSLEVHKAINLILYDIWAELYGRSFADRMVEKESKLAIVYRKAWKWALSFNKEDGAKKFLELKNIRMEKAHRSIRRCNMDDAQEVLSVINRSNADAYGKIIPPEYFKEPVFTYDNILKKFSEMTFYAYELKGRIVGVAALQTESQHSGHIRFVYILPEQQRKGIGTSLVSYIEAEARKLGLKNLRVPYVDTNARWAINFYIKLGYKVVEKREKPWGYDLFFEKELQ
ncbi:MAG: acetyltransferase [Candidatus Bathyarchaeota archaeon BA1]|nr:MAG: acetyltransferase [Candidatus Bathyarchaeota archaeon BA1]